MRYQRLVARAAVILLSGVLMVAALTLGVPDNKIAAILADEAEISENTVTVSPNSAGKPAQYTIEFSPDATISVGDTIIVAFPFGTGVPSSPNYENIFIANDAEPQINVEDGGVTVDINTVTLLSPVAIPAQGTCTITFIEAAGIVNPSLSHEPATGDGDGIGTPGYTIGISTSLDPTVVYSNPYCIYNWIEADSMTLEKDEPVTIIGGGFFPGLSVSLSPTGGAVGFGEVQSDGTFSIEAFATGIAQPITATDGSGRSASTSTPVTVEPRLNMIPKCGLSGSIVAIWGYDFTGVPVSFSIGGIELPEQVLTLVDTDMDGQSDDFGPLTITIPPSLGLRLNVINATDVNTKIATTSFEVTDGPCMTVDPASGPPLTPIVVTGACFPPDSGGTVDDAIYFVYSPGSQTAIKSHVATDDDGFCSGVVQIPVDASPGMYQIMAVIGTEIAIAEFEVTEDPPVITMDVEPFSGPPNTYIEASGTGLTPDSVGSLLFAYTQTYVVEIGNNLQTDNEGSFTCDGIIPLDATPGLYYIVATAGTLPDLDTAMGFFEVTDAPPVIYVDEDATGVNNGTSWMDAYTDLQSALDIAIPGSEIWVAEGTYNPLAEFGGAGNRYKAFKMKNGVGIYGGFAGTENPATFDLRDRNILANETILSGDLNGDDIPGDLSTNRSDNCYHVFYHPSGTGLDITAVLDGFTITGGNATGSEDHGNGGAIFNASSSPTLTNCTFSGNYAERGGGIYDLSSSSPTITNSTFSNNSVRYDGAGMYIESSSTTLINCVFSDNSAGYNAGGICNLNSSSLSLTNCTFYGNSATSYGGGLANFNTCSLVIQNSIFWGNTVAAEKDQIYNSGTASISFTDIEESNGSGASWDTSLGTDNGGNIDEDPLFANASSGDFHLQTNSLCIDAGDNSAPSLPATDFEGDDRRIDDPSTPDTGNGTSPIVDMGVDEYTVSIVCIDMPLKSVWNMVSVPVIPEDNSVAAVFPGVEVVYTWDPVTKSYYIPTEIEPEKGYWVAVLSDMVITVCGSPVNSWTDDMTTVWNMIGSVSGSVDFTNPDDDPDGSVEPFAYQWDPVGKSYVLVTTLDPTKGHWIAATQECTLTLSVP